MTEQILAIETAPAIRRTRTIGGALRTNMPPLTSLRFFAALGVVLFHFGSGAARTANAPAPLVSLLSNGYLGVAFFFVLSGFILHAVYSGRLESAKQLRGFAVARLARIYPVYLLGLLLILPFQQPHGWKATLLAPLLLHSWTIPSSNLGQTWNAPGWTLSVELFFYLAFPMVHGTIQRAHRVTLLLIIAAIVAFVLWAQTPTLDPGSTGLAPPVNGIPLPLLRIPEFILGCAAAEVMGRLRAMPTSASTDIALCLVALGIVGLMASGPWCAGLVGISFAPLVALAAISVGPVGRALSKPSLVLLGGASYSMYLLQYPVHDAVHSLLGNTPASRVGGPLLLIPVAVIAFKLIEEPARIWLRRLTVR